MASDIFKDMTTGTAEDDSAIDRDVSKQLASVGKATHFFQVGDQSVGLVRAGDRIALNTIDAVNGNPDLMAEWGLRASRPLGNDFLVYESASQLDQAFIDRLIGSGLVEEMGTVFRNTDNGTEAVLLNEAIVSLKSGMTADRFFENRSEFLGYRPLGGTPDQFIVTLAGGYGERALDAVNALSNDPGLNWTAPNFHQAWQKFYIPNDERFGNLWHLHNTGQGGGLVDADPDLPEAWDVIQGGSTSLVIGIVDDGVSTDHSDLNPWVNVGEIPGNGLDDDGNGWVDDVNGWNFVNNNNVSVPNTVNDGHGTAVAGVAAARGDNGIGVTGASYNTRVLSARIFAGTAVATDAGIAEAIYYAAGRKRDGSGTWQAGDLSNHSWGGGAASAAINSALTWATSQGRSGQGSLQVFAAGNSGATVGYPATQAAVNSGIAVVGSVNNFGAVSSYSSFGPLVDVVAPSDDYLVSGRLAIDTTDRIGAAGYSAGDYTGTGAQGFGGTSSAAPLATGIMALAIARGQSLGINLSPPQLRSLMRVNTDLIASETYNLSTGQSNKSGYGRINAASLVSAIGSREISVLSGNGEVVSGTTTVEFGTVNAGSFVDAMFQIRNQGTVALDISGLTVDSGSFSIIQSPADLNLDLGEATTFRVRFSPTSDATTISTVRITSNDSDEAIFSFNVRGIGNLPSVAGTVFEDWDGDALYDFDDPGFANHVVFLDANLNGTLDASVFPFTNTTNYNIPDNNTTGVLSPITVSGLAQNVADINVTINVTHTWVGDLEVVLIGPNAVRVPLATRRGSSGDNFTNTTFDDQASTPITGGTAPFTGSFRPQSPLSVFNGINPNGTWSLEIKDRLSGDTGRLLNWTINVGQSERSTVTTAGGSFLFDDLAPGTYRLATTPRSGFSMSTVSFRDFTIVQPSDSFPGLDFGFYRSNRFYGKVFEDINMDGLQGTTENGLPGQFLVRPNSTEVTNTFSSVASVPIVDLGLAISEIAVTNMPSEITDVNVTLNITHTWVADLEVFLHAPDGTIVELFTRVGDSGENFTGTILDDSATTSITAGTAPFTGTFRPEGVLASFNGRQPNGTWKLYVFDRVGGDVGSIANWSLRIVSIGDYRSSTDSFGRSSFDLPNGTHTVSLQTEPGIFWVFIAPPDGKRTVTVPATLFNQSYGVKKNLAPTLEQPANMTIDEDAAEQTVNLSGITAGAGETQPLAIEATSSNTALIPNPTVYYTSPDVTGSLRFTPVSNQSGTVVITAKVIDGGLDGNFGTTSDNNFVTRSFTVTVNAVNDAPTDIAISSSNIAENGGANAVVGTLSTTDVDAGNTFTYTLVAGTGDADNAVFNINGSSLRANSSFDFETKSSYSVRIRSTDQGGLFTEKVFTISVINTNELVSVTVNGADSYLNASQRSQVTSIVIATESVLASPQSAFSLVNIGLLSASSTNLASSQILVTNVGNVYTIRFGAGSGVVTRAGTGTRGNSLADGNWILTISGSEVTGSNQFGNRSVDNFFRMFGDSDGDGDVDGVDAVALRNAQLAATYNASLDWDGNGSVTSGVDINNFSANRNKRRRSF